MHFGESFLKHLSESSEIARRDFHPPTEKCPGRDIRNKSFAHFRDETKQISGRRTASRVTIHINFYMQPGLVARLMDAKIHSEDLRRRIKSRGERGKAACRGIWVCWERSIMGWGKIGIAKKNIVKCSVSIA